jgi:plastocyanin domain-containing protein
MTPDRIIVTVGGLGVVGFIAWFFWLKRTAGVKASLMSDGYQEVMVLVKGGYTPDTIRVVRGRPVRLLFRREETAACSEQVVLPDFGKSAALPTGAIVPVEFMPGEPGEHEFTCQMGMLRGRIVVEGA